MLAIFSYFWEKLTQKNFTLWVKEIKKPKEAK